MECRDCQTEFEPFQKGRKQCRDCYNEYMREYMLARYHRRRAGLIAARGGICANCRNSADVFEIDHIDQYGKSFDLGSAIASWSEKRIQAEFEKCQVLCVPCHRAKTRKDLAARFGQREHWEHGTLGGYRHCKCDDCKRAARDWHREYRKRKQAPIV